MRGDSILDQLSDSERQVAGLVMAGQKYGDIASVRQRASRTVANQVASIFRKVGVKTREELVARIMGRHAPPGKTIR